MTISIAEENYLKAIYKLAENLTPESYVSTNPIAYAMDTKASSVTDMLKRLAEKKLVLYTKYKGVRLSEEGEAQAKYLVRKHRLWEVFLVEKLNFNWSEVHAIAEQLEHIRSEELVNRLESYLNHPQFDPHGDPIPDKKGNIRHQYELLLSDLSTEQKGVIVGVRNHSNDFLEYLDSMQLVLGTEVQIMRHHSYDNSVEILLNSETTCSISQKVSQNLFVTLAES